MAGRKGYWRVYVPGWQDVYHSDASGHGGFLECLRHQRERYPELVRGDQARAVQARAVPWSGHRQDDWPWSLELWRPVLRGEWRWRDDAVEMAGRWEGAVVVQEGSPQEAELLSFGETRRP